MIRNDEYLETRVMTAPPHQLHLMVVDGALRHARLAADALDREEFEAAHFALGDARNFVSELVGGLDEERAPDVVENLRALFAFAYKNLVHADLEREPRLVRDAIRVLELHRETWTSLATEISLTAASGTATTDTTNDGSARTGREWTT